MVTFQEKTKQKPRKKKIKTVKPKKDIKQKELNVASGSITNMHYINKMQQEYRNSGYTYQQLQEHDPVMEMVRVDTPRIIASTLTAKQEEADLQISGYFYNSMQEIDYLVIEAIVQNTPVGEYVNFLTQFVMGKGFKPELELIESTKDEQKDLELLEKGEHILKELTHIDDTISENGNMSIIDAFHQSIYNMFAYNRSALFFGEDNYVSKNGTTHSKIPNTFYPIHPREMGALRLDKNWKITSVQHGQSGKLINADEMIYFYDPTLSGKAFHSNFYGNSRILPCLGSAREIQNIVNITLPAINYGAWAGYALINVVSKGQTLSEKRAIHKEISDSFNIGATNLLVSDEDVKVHNITYSADVDKIIESGNFHLKLILSALGLPQSLLADEGESNRATAIEKIRITRSVTIDPIRAMLSRMISKQWYQRNFRILYSGKPEFELYKIKTVFDDYTLETWADQLESFSKLHAMFPIKNKEAGDMLGIDNFESKIDPEKEPVSNKSMTVTDENGDSFNVDES